MQALYDDAHRLFDAMNAVYDRVLATPCQSLDDCIAVIEWADGDADAVIDTVLPCLQQLAGVA